MPEVSIIIPCLNEVKTIYKTLEAIFWQDYPIRDMEVVIADGGSTDGTIEEIKRFQDEKKELVIKTVKNPKKDIPSGLNIAWKFATGKYIIRLDGHSTPKQDYLTRTTNALKAGLGENVGGVWDIKPSGPGWVAESIAFAASNPFAVGDAYYRFATKAGYVDTVPFGGFERKTLEQIGGYNETLKSNEDYELNSRIRRNGGRIWLDPEIRSSYFARSTFTELAAQYHRYGYWKAKMLKNNPETLRWRQAIPPLFVLGVAGLIVLSFISTVARLILFIGLAFYTMILILSSIKNVRTNKKISLLPGIPMAIATMHGCWGFGFWQGMFSR